MDKLFITPISLQNNTFSRLFVGLNVVTLDRVDSTNNYLKNELSKSAPLPEGTVILAEEQFAGRGQTNNSWISAPGQNLTFSLLLSPTFLHPEKQFFLNKSISIAINDALVNIIGAEIKIKWPNDIYFKDKKLGGVLIENILRGNKWLYSIIGIGLNVNQTRFSPIIKNVTSLKKILHQDYDRNLLLQDICNSIEEKYLQLKAENYEALNKDYLKSLYKIDEWHTFEIKGVLKQGKISGVDKNGLLEIYIDDELRRYNLKDIAYVFNK